MPPNLLESTQLTDCYKELILSLSMAKKPATSHIQKALVKYKKFHDKKAKLKIGEWILVRFPHEESGHMRKPSRPWHGPF